jgi:hypothetical protein
VACSCGKNKTKSGSYEVKLPGGLKVTRSTEASAAAFAARHPGATVTKKA